MNIQLWLSLLPWLFLLASSTPNIGNNSDSNELGPLRNVCVSTVSQIVSYFHRVYATRTISTRKCKLIVFCKTIYRLQRISRLERKLKTVYRMKAHCCQSFVKVDNLCVSETTPTVTTSVMSTSKTFFEIQTSKRIRINGGPLLTQPAISGTTKPSPPRNQTVIASYTNGSQPSQYNEIHITSGSNQNTIIAVVICIVVAACVIAAFIVVYRRRRKAEKSASEIPCDKEVLSLPPNTQNNCSDLPEGLHCTVTAPQQENYYVSMNNGCTSDTPNVNRMLSTRGSRYRFADLDEGNCSKRPRTDTLYVLPDPRFRQGGANSCEQTKGLAQNCGGSSNIYINQGQESSMGNSTDNDDDDIYSEIKTSANYAQQLLHHVTYEDIDQSNKTDVNGNNGGAHGRDGGSVGRDVKGKPMELMELSKHDVQDTYNIPKPCSRYKKRALSNDHDDDDDEDDNKNNNGSNSDMEGCRSKTCDSGIYIYLNGKEEDGEEEEQQEEEEEETDLIYSVPYSNNNNNNNSNNLLYSNKQKPRKQPRAAVKSLVYQNAAFSGRDAERSDGTAMINTSSPSSSSPTSSPSLLPSSSSLRQWPNNDKIYTDVPDASSDDQTLYQDIGNTKSEFHV